MGTRNDAILVDVTHLACRSARAIRQLQMLALFARKGARSAFRVAPGAAMPPGEGCNKQDDAVLFVIGVAVEN